MLTRVTGRAWHGLLPVTVAPNGGRLVIFPSRKLLHAVLPTFAPRFALSCWILEDPMSKLAFLDK